VTTNLIPSKVISENRGKNKSTIMPSMNTSTYDHKNISYEGNEGRGRLNISTNMTKMSDPGNITTYGLAKFKPSGSIRVTPNAELSSSVEGGHGSLVYQTSYPRHSNFSLRNNAQVINRKSLGVPSVKMSHSGNYMIGGKHQKDNRVRFLIFKNVD
jgi:hypothetical protein